MKILLVEDDPVLAEQLSIDLTRQNYLVEAVLDAESAWEYAHAANYDLIVLDVQLPGSDGISLCQKLRQANYDSAILLLTANSDNADKVRGLDAGADDYVVKPCTSEELCARIRALLRRPRSKPLTALQCGGLRLDPNTCEVFYQDQEITLSPKEYGLLELFLRHPQRVFSSEVLLDKLWSFEETPGEETIRTHVKRLRRKLKRAGADQVIENIYGMGYRLNAAIAAENGPPVDAETTPPHRAKAATNPSAQKTPDGLQSTARNAAAAAMSRFQPEFVERLTKLDQLVESLTLGDRSDQLLHQAQQAVHKLVGSLGMFGLVDGSRLCQDIEKLLKAPHSTADIDQASLQRLVGQLHQQLDPLLATSSTRPIEPLPESTPTDMLAIEHPLKALLITDCLEDFAELQTLVPMRAIQPTRADEQVLEHKPDVVILDMAAFAEPSQGCAWLAKLAAQFPDLPIMVLVAEDDFQLRLNIIRFSNKSICVLRTVSPSQLVDSVNSLYRQHFIAKLHILVVDDDPVLLEVLEHQLTTDGFKVTTLGEPQHLWESLNLVRPDLLLLDFEMPEVNGVELCRVIRADIHWRHLPILFLSGQQDPELMQTVFQAGADDYIAKPATHSELLTRILSRVRRSRQMTT